MMGVRMMGMQDVQQIVNIHLSSWAANEFSVKMGREFLNILYAEIVASPLAFTVVWDDNGTIAGYASGFARYADFNAKLRRRHFPALIRITLMALLIGRMSFGDVINQLCDDRKTRKTRFPDHHWGAMALANQLKGTPRGREVADAVIDGVFERLRAMGCPGIWGLCDERNIPMRKYLERLEFTEVETIRFIGKRVVLYEHEFRPDG